MKKRKYVAIAACLLSLMLVFGVIFVGCGEPNEEHTHKLVKTNAVEATCTEQGNKEYYKCSGCGKYFSDADGKKEIKLSDTVIAAKGHDLDKVAAVEATCTVSGMREHYKCSDCGALFTDAEGKTATTEAQLSVPATAHDYESEYTFDDEKHWHKCSDCSATDTKEYHDCTLSLSGGKREYNKGDALDTTGMSGTLGCEKCDFTETVDITTDMVTGFDSSVSGTQTLTVTWRAGDSISATAAYDVTVSEVAAKYNVTLENAEYADGSSVKELESGNGLPSDIKLIDGQTFMGWYDRTGNVWYGTDVSGLPAAAVTLTAVYEADMTLFTPACVIENMADSSDRRTMTHDDLNGAEGTRFAFSGGVTEGLGFKILNGDSLVTSTDDCVNICPLTEEHGGLLMLTVKNEGATSVSFKYQVEYWGIRGEVSVTVGAGEVKDVPLIYGANPAGKGEYNTPFNQLIFNESVQGDVSLLISGKYYIYSHYGINTLTFDGATYNGETSVSLMNGSSISADSIELTETGKTFAGWKSNGKVYLTDEELAAAFIMPASDCTVKAVYVEDMSVYTPSCTYKDKSKSDSEKQTGTHNDEGATTYTIDLSVPTWVIYNSAADETHDVANDCPVHTSQEMLYKMTFTNSGDSDLTIEIGPEYFGLKYAVTLTIPAGETVSKTMKLGTFDSDQTRTFWEIHNKSVSQGTAELTVMGVYA